MFKRKGRRSNIRRRRPARRSRGKGSIMSMVAMNTDRSQTAHIKETFASNIHSQLKPNVDIEANFSLNQFPRAWAMSSLFKFYRAKRVTYTYQPFYNTFQEGIGAGSNVVGKPQVYIAMNRSGDITGLTYAQVLELGSKPIPFVKNLVLSYKPNWLIGGLTNANALNNPAASVFSMGAKVSYDWLPTVPVLTAPGYAGPVAQNQIEISQQVNIGGPSTVVNVHATYQGHRLYISQPNAPVDNIIALETITVEWEFKGANPGVPATSVTETVNLSQ